MVVPDENNSSKQKAAAETVLIKNGTLLTMAAKKGENEKSETSNTNTAQPNMAGKRRGEDILLEAGKIKQIGPNLPEPTGQNARVIDADGKLVMPGFIDAHTHLGVAEEGIGFEGSDFNEIAGPITPEMRAIDGINPEEAGLQDAWQAGVTSVITGPGSANVIGGQSVAMKTHGEIVDRMVIKDPAGVKAAFGENPKRVYSEQSKSPYTRMATAALLRKTLFEAREYKRKWEDYHAQLQKYRRGETRDEAEKTGEEGEPKPPEKDMQKEIMAKVLDRALPLRAHAHRADDIMTAVRIAREFHILLTVEHCTEGHKVAQELKKAGIPAVVGPSLTSRAKVELRERTFETPRILFEQRVQFAITTDHPVIPIYTLPICTAMAVREGLPWEAGLRAITHSAAEIAGIDHRVGSLAEGKDADILIFGHDPLQVDAAPEHVFVNGYEVIGPSAR